MSGPKKRVSRLELLEKTLAEAEAGLERAIAGKNPTAEANILSRLHTIRTAYADLLDTIEPEDDEVPPDEIGDLIVELLPDVDDADLDRIGEAFAARRRRGRRV